MQPKTWGAVFAGILLALAMPGRAQQLPPPTGQVIEEIIARVNNDIITNTQIEKAKGALRDEIKTDCSACTPAQLDTRYNDQVKNVLRDLIDQSLLVQRAQDEGINVDTDVIKQLDDIRQQNHIDSLEDLQKAVEAAGINWDDYKDSIRKHLLTDDLIKRDVGGRIEITHEEVQSFYNAHKDQFNRPETVVVREIFVSTKGKTPAQVEELRKKAETIRQRVLNGEDFGALAKLFSDGSTARQGGELGAYRRGQLSKQIEDAVFKLDHNQLTPVIQTQQGFEILQVERHFQAGVQPLDAVEDEIENQIYEQKIGPQLRDYLKTLREQSYIKIKPGYIDTAAVAATSIEEVQPGSSDNNGKKKKKKAKVKADG